MSGAIDGTRARQHDISTEATQAPQAPSAPPDEAPASAPAAAPSARAMQSTWDLHAADPGAAAWRAKLGDTAGAVAQAKVVKEPSLSDRFSHWVGSIGRDVSEAGEALDRSASAIAGKLSRGVESGLRSVGGAAQVLGGEIAAAPHTLTSLRDGIRDLGKRAIDLGDRGLRAVEDGARELAGGAQRLGAKVAQGVEDALEGAESAARRVIDSGRKLYDSVTSALDPLNEVKVGSSRVDLQACKLEYSIVSPK